MWVKEQGDKKTKDSNEILRVYYKLGHLLFAKIRFMSAVGEMGKRLSKCMVPEFMGCVYGKATRRPWRAKEEVGHILKYSAPGDVIFVDQLTGSTPGHITQVSGFLTQSRYHFVTVSLQQLPLNCYAKDAQVWKM